MRRVIAIAVAGVGLAGCSSLSFDALKPVPPTVQVQLESVPPGVDAVTSLGPACKTPCTVAVPALDSGFSVTFSMNRFQSATIPVQVIRIPGDFSAPGSISVDPNPVVAELQPAGPPPKAARKKMLAPKKPKPPKPPKPAAAAPAPTPAPAPASR